MPVARKVWQPIFVLILAFFARLWIIRKALSRVRGCVVSRPVLKIGRAEEGPSFVISNSGGFNVAIGVLLETVMHGHFVVLAASI
jgi:hypothetical protein